ncbi:MAG: tetratricopeptide repeat protein, partial [Deltaproteobacteria bacterium]|nr:tetratricopeptide repeat protein [Deltaproteobacteria bacterium]
EQVAEPAAAAVQAWLERAPELVVLATSRRPLHVGGEQQLPIDPLGTNPAVQLFVERAQEVKSGFALTDANRGDIEAIVSDLDGLPLAIELAAARTRVLPPAAVRKRMAQRFDLLKGKRRGVPDRQATLRGAIEGSWDLLDTTEKVALAQCAVFVGSFSLEAAEAVLDLGDADAWPMDVIEGLADHSLLRTAGEGDEPRFALLRSIQAYAAEKLDSGTRSAAEVRHGAFFADAAVQLQRDLSGPSGVEAASGLADDVHNLLAAGTRAVARGDIEAAVSTVRAVAAWRHRVGPFAPALAAVESVLALDGLKDPDRAALLGDRARLAGPSARVDSVVRGLDQAVALSAAADAFALCADLRRDLAGALRRAGRADEATEQLTLAHATHTQLGDEHGAALDALNQANLALGRGDRREAERGYRETIEVLHRLGDSAREAAARANLGILLLQRGELDEAREALLTALAGGEKVADRRRQAAVRNALGVVETEAGRLEEASTALRAALESARRLGDRRTEGRVLGNLGTVARRRGRLDEARAHVEDALGVHRDVGNARSAALTQGLLGEVLLDAGDPAGARASLEQAIQEADALGFTAASGRARATLGRSLGRLGELDAAMAMYSEGREQLRDAEAHDDHARLLLLRAGTALDAGDSTSARADLVGARLLMLQQPTVAFDQEVVESIAALDARLSAG